MLPFRMSW